MSNAALLLGAANLECRVGFYLPAVPVRRTTLAGGLLWPRWRDVRFATTGGYPAVTPQDIE